MSGTGKDVETATFPLTVDYTKSLAEVMAAGNYEYADPKITEAHFPTVQSEVKVEDNAILVHFDRVGVIDTEDVLEELERLGLRPGTMFELVAFGKQHLDHCQRCVIVALGSKWRGPDGNSVGCIWDYPDRRRLNLRWYRERWLMSRRFLAFRK